MATESGTPELKQHHQVNEEKLDSRGIFRRSRVVDQYLIDKLFLTGDIKIHQFCAGEMYIELLWKAGSFLRSPSLDKEIESKGGGGEVEKSMSSRIMVISKARSALRECRPEVVLAVDVCLAANRRVDLNLLREGLDALSRHFGVDRVRDPRDI